MRNAIKGVLAVVAMALPACSDSTQPALEVVDVHTVSANQSALAVADVNADGFADVITLDTNGNVGARVFLGSAAGTFSALGSIDLGASRELVVADVSRDGTADILGLTAGSLYVSRGSAQGPGAATAYPMPSAAVTFATGDVDADQVSDISVILNGANSQLALRLLEPRASDGQLEAAIDYQSATVASGARGCVADVTGEGHPDVVIATTTASTPVLVLPNLGGPTFENPVKVGVGQLSTLAHARLACADFDGDGRKDVALLRHAGMTSSLTILMGTAQAVTIGASINIGPGTDVAVVDVDHDGRVDVLVASPADGAVLFVKNMGNGNFAQPAAILAGSNPEFIVVHDVDGDQQADIVTLSLDGKLGVFRSRAGHP